MSDKRRQSARLYSHTADGACACAGPPTTVWTNDCIGPYPFQRWSESEALESGVKVPNAAFLSHGDIVTLDATALSITPSEGIALDPQQRLIFANVYESLNGAFIDSTRHKASTSHAGVFVGISTVEYKQVLAKYSSGMTPFTATGTALSVASGRISYAFGLHGPATSTDTACSSSLVSLHQAYAHVKHTDHDGSAALPAFDAVVCGVNVALIAAGFGACRAAGMLSPDSRCKVLDASADGYVRGEGCGATVLRASASSSDASHIAVVGASTNQDGRSSTLTAPHGPSQQKVVVSALRSSLIGAVPLAVQLHGTGTSLGDPIELGALLSALRSAAHGQQSGMLDLQAAKSLVGHLEAGSGIVGAIATWMALRWRAASPVLHIITVNPHVRAALDDACPLLASGPRSLKGSMATADGIATSSVSSFAFMGTNVHVVSSASLTACSSTTSARMLRMWQVQHLYVQAMRPHRMLDALAPSLAFSNVVRNASHVLPLATASVPLSHREMLLSDACSKEGMAVVCPFAALELTCAFGAMMGVGTRTGGGCLVARDIVFEKQAIVDTSQEVHGQVLLTHGGLFSLHGPHGTTLRCTFARAIEASSMEWCRKQNASSSSSAISIITSDSARAACTDRIRNGLARGLRGGTTAFFASLATGDAIHTRMFPPTDARALITNVAGALAGRDVASADAGWCYLRSIASCSMMQTCMPMPSNDPAIGTIDGRVWAAPAPGCAADAPALCASVRSAGSQSATFDVSELRLGWMEHTSLAQLYAESRRAEEEAALNAGDAQAGAAISAKSAAYEQKGLLQAVRDTVQAVLGVQPESDDEPLALLGLDSLTAMELRGAIQRDFSTTLSETLLTDDPPATLRGLAAAISAATHSAHSEPKEVQPAPSISQPVVSVCSEMTREESSSPFSGVRATEPFQFDNITFRESDALAAPLPPLSARKRRAMATHGDDDSEADFFDAYEEAPRNLTDAAQLRWRGHSRDSDRPDTFRGDRGAGAHAAARATAAAAAALDADFGEGVEDPEREGFRFSSGRRAR